MGITVVTLYALNTSKKQLNKDQLHYVLYVIILSNAVDTHTHTHTHTKTNDSIEFEIFKLRVIC